MIDLRHNVALLNTDNTSAANKNEKKLQSLHDSLFKSILEQVKNVLTNLQAFIASDISFSAKVYFNEPFCKQYVREILLIPFLKYVANANGEYSTGAHDPVPYPVLLVLSRLCLQFESVAIDYLITLVDEQFFISDKNETTNKKELFDLFRDSAKVAKIF